MSLKIAENLIEAGEFQQAYEEIVADLATARDSNELIRLSRVLSGKVRSKCMDLACNKATDGSPLAKELEALLRKIGAINGEDVYGQIPSRK